MGALRIVKPECADPSGIELKFVEPLREVVKTCGYAVVLLPGREQNGAQTPRSSGIVDWRGQEKVAWVPSRDFGQQARDPIGDGLPMGV